MSLCSPLCLHSISRSARISSRFFSPPFDRSVYYCYHVRRNRLGWNEMNAKSADIFYCADKPLLGDPRRYKVENGQESAEGRWLANLLRPPLTFRGEKSVPGSHHRGESLTITICHVSSNARPATPHKNSIFPHRYRAWGNQDGYWWAVECVFAFHHLILGDWNFNEVLAIFFRCPGPSDEWVARWEC